MLELIFKMSVMMKMNEEVGFYIQPGMLVAASAMAVAKGVKWRMETSRSGLNQQRIRR